MAAVQNHDDDEPPEQATPATLQAAMTKSMLYTMPIMMGVFASNMPAGLGLYWTISNLFGILQPGNFDLSIIKRNLQRRQHSNGRN